jgi:Cu/Ag efflux protein CusF
MKSPTHQKHWHGGDDHAFKVAETVKLAPFKVGQKVRFTVTETNGHLVVDQMERAK